MTSGTDSSGKEERSQLLITYSGMYPAGMGKSEIGLLALTRILNQGLFNNFCTGLSSC